MKAHETKLQHIIEGTNQYVVPLFQRPYSWDRKEWTTLWEDLLALCESAGQKNHFMGSIVTIPTKSVPEGVGKFLLIDGQQRLTTLFVILTVIRDLAREKPGNLADEIEQTLLTNPFKEGMDRLKLLPTQTDRDAFQSLIQTTEGPCTHSGPNQLQTAYRFFQRQVRTSAELDLAQLKQVIVGNLLLVSIVLDNDDNPHVIFEGLNWKGRVLSQADLIRNYFFMRINVAHQEELYGQFWKPMHDRLGEDLTEFMRHFLMRGHPFIRIGDVYSALKERADSEKKTQPDIVAYLKEVATFAEYYSRIIHPDQEPQAHLRARFTRLNTLEVSIAYCFLLDLYGQYICGELALADFCSLLDMIENMVIRRWVCSVPRGELNRIFPVLYVQARAGKNMVEGVTRLLTERNYPTDDVFADRLGAMQLYGTANRQPRARLILERIEESFEHHEPVKMDTVTVEHLMPQVLTDEWKKALGEGWEQVYEQYLHTLGNLTLTGYNRELSNSSWDRKRCILEESNVELNKGLSAVPVWNAERIVERSERLVERALTVWPYRGSKPTGADAGRIPVTHSVPRAVVFRGARFEVKTWRDVGQRTVECVMMALDESQREELASRFPRFISADVVKLRSARPLAGGIFMEQHLSARQMYGLCVQFVDCAEMAPEDWRVEVQGQVDDIPLLSE